MFKQDQRADLVFMMDCTISMNPYIKESKRQIKDIASLLMKKFENQVGPSRMLFYWLVVLFLVNHFFDESSWWVHYLLWSEAGSTHLNSEGGRITYWFDLLSLQDLLLGINRISARKVFFQHKLV